MEEEKSLLVCKRLDQLSEEQAAKTNSIKVACEFCNTWVWMTPTNFIILEKKDAKIACITCARRLMKEEMAKGEEVFEIPAGPVAKKLMQG